MEPFPEEEFAQWATRNWGKDAVEDLIKEWQQLEAEIVDKALDKEKRE